MTIYIVQGYMPAEYDDAADYVYDIIAYVVKAEAERHVIYAKNEAERLSKLPEAEKEKLEDTEGVSTYDPQLYVMDAGYIQYCVHDLELNEGPFSGVT